MSDAEMKSLGTTGPFTRAERLLDSRDYRRVLRRGRRRSSPELVVITTPRRVIQSEINELSDSERLGSRLGITASRKLGGAVVRNRFKRRTREWFRRRRDLLDVDLDLVVIARRSAADLSFVELDRRLCSLLGLDATARAAKAE